MATLRDRMKDAAYNDIAANEDKRPAISKLKMLNTVTAALTKYALNKCEFSEYMSFIMTLLFLFSS